MIKEFIKLSGVFLYGVLICLIILTLPACATTGQVVCRLGPDGRLVCSGSVDVPDTVAI